MSVPGPQEVYQSNKTYHIDGTVDSSGHTVSVDTTSATKTDVAVVGSLLQAPLHIPARPLSPDTLSNISAEEYIHFLPPATVSSARHDDDAGGPQGLRYRLAVSWRRNKGLFYMLMAQFFGTLMNVTTRLLEVEGNNGKGFHPFQILFARMGITMLLASLYMWWRQIPDFPFGKPEVRLLLVARGFCGFFGVFGMYYSLLYLPLADATVITFLAPSLACWACSILIKEPFTRVEQIAGLVSLFGVVLIARPTALFSFAISEDTDADGTSSTTNATIAGSATDYDHVTSGQRLAAVGVAMLGVFGAAGAYTTLRWIGKRTYPLISVNYFATWSFCISIIAQLSLPGIGFLIPATLKDWAYLTFLGSCGFVMQYLLVLALSYEKSSRSTNMTYTQMLFALTFDKLVFDHSPGWISIIGSSLILGSAIVVAVQQDTSRNKAVADEESQQRLAADEHQDLAQEVPLRMLR